MSQSDSNRAEGAPKSRKLIYGVLALGVVIIIALLGVIIFLLTRPQEVPKPSIDEGRATIVTPENVDKVIAQQEQPVVAGYYTCKMNVDWHFKDGASPSYDAYVANSKSNEFTVYFDVFLEGTGEMVYSSPYMPVGSELSDITLTKDLDAGDYLSVVTYHLVDEDKTELSTVSVTVTLHVEN